MLRFLVDLRKVKKEFRAKFGDEEYSKKSMEIFCKCVAVISKGWNIYYSPLILGGYVIKRNHHVNSLGLNGSKIHAIYLVELRKEMT